MEERKRRFGTPKKKDEVLGSKKQKQGPVDEKQQIISAVKCSRPAVVKKN